MTFNEAKKLLKSKNMYFIKENSVFGTFEEYKAKLSDLWAERFGEDENAITLDELLLNPDFEEIAQNSYETEVEPTETVDTLVNMYENDEGDESFEDYDEDTENNEEIEDDLDFENGKAEFNPDDFENLDDDTWENEINNKNNEIVDQELEDSFDEAANYLRKRGYMINEDAQLLNEAWYDSIDLSADDKRFVKSVTDNFASAKSKVKDGIRGGYMTPAKRARFYDELSRVAEIVSPHGARYRAKVQADMRLLEDENWYNFIAEKNPQLDPNDIPGLVGHAELGDEAHLTPEELTARREARRAAEERARQEEEARRAREEEERRERERRENPEPEDMVSREEFEETPEDVITTRRVTRRRMRTNSREFHDQHRIPTAMITVNIDTTNDPDTLHEAEEIVNTIKERLRIAYNGDEVMTSLCNVDAAEVDIEEDGETRKEYHVVIKMPVEIKEEIARLVKDELEDAFTFVNAEHPEDAVYEFETNGTRDEVDDEEYEYEEPVVQRRRIRPQTTGVRRVNRTPRWRVHYTLAKDDGTDSGIQRTVVVPAATAADAKNKVENPEDIDNAYATGVFAVTGVDRI